MGYKHITPHILWIFSTFCAHLTVFSGKKYWKGTWCFQRRNDFGYAFQNVAIITSSSRHRETWRKSYRLTWTLNILNWSFPCVRNTLWAICYCVYVCLVIKFCSVRDSLFAQRSSLSVSVTVMIVTKVVKIQYVQIKLIFQFCLHILFTVFYS